MDQVTHIALFDDLCTPHGLDYYLDDFRYTWWRSHNGFEASRLAPDLERKRITRLVSQPLIESFREEVIEDPAPVGLQPVTRLVRPRPPGGHGGHPGLLQLPSADGDRP